MTQKAQNQNSAEKPADGEKEETARSRFFSRLFAVLKEYVPLFSSRYSRVVSAVSGRKRSISSWQNFAAITLIFASAVSGVATYAALNEMPPFGNDPDTIIWLLTLDLVLLLALVALVARRVVAIWSNRRRGLAGSHLHVRLVYIFSFMAAVPAVVMTVFSVFFFYYGIQTWFSERVQTAVNESQNVAKAYLEEHKQVIRADTLAMANDLNRQVHLLAVNEEAFTQIVQTQSILRNLSEAIVFDGSGRVLARSGLTFSLEFEEIPAFALEQAQGGEVALMTGSNDDRVRALLKLSNFIDAYLFVGRMVDPQVLSHLAATQKASEDYEVLQLRSTHLQIVVTMIFIVIGLLLMFAAIWFGFMLARQLVNPISDLVLTSDRVRAGDLSARVKAQGKIEEFDYLAVSFNRMTKQIQEQQNELIDANRQLDRRRRFTEAVLAGVTSGIIGVDPKGKINLANSSAEKLLGSDAESLSGKGISKVAGEFGALLKQAHERPSKITQAEIPVAQKDGTRRAFLVRIAIEQIGDEDVGAIITFDDITDLQSAQRKAAWADVARRIAHEIKNPLTPIQLSAERLKRKYLKQITDDPETFSQCTDTIIRHVEDIGLMVSEFSSFARMPEPVMRREILNDVVREAVVLHKQAHDSISFEIVGIDDEVYYAQLDAQQIRQALNNLIQNAIDSVNARVEADGKKAKSGAVRILIVDGEDNEVAIAVCDNGLGLPKAEALSSLTEPYVTHKAKGTGLGLAIVKKIMEDHGGDVILGGPEWLDDVDGLKGLGGAFVSLVLRCDVASRAADVGNAPAKVVNG